jgi:hypothetical protein
MKLCLPLILALNLVWLPAQAKPLAVGDSVPTILAKDQHGNEFLFTNNVRVLLAVTEMAPAKAANLKLAEQGAGFLERHRAAYLMDIHSMPAVARFFALPKLQKYPQRIVLIERKKTLQAFPFKPGSVTVLTLSSSGHIKKIDYWHPDREPVAKYLP